MWANIGPRKTVLDLNTNYLITKLYLQLSVDTITLSRDITFIVLISVLYVS